jgi:hypothetical protein
MCLDCGCGKPDDDHGDARHITLATLQAAAEASGVSVDEVAARVYTGATTTPLEGLREPPTPRRRSRSR